MLATLGLSLVMISVDLEWDPLWDLSLPATFHALMSLVIYGCIDALFAGPPCATWSRLRFRPGGPAPLRRRGLESRGLAGCRGRLLHELCNANVLVLKT